MSVILVCGFPASGKSTVTKSYVNQGYIELNRDTEGGTIAQLLPKMEILLQNKKSIILDNLFPTVESRKPFINLAKKYNKNISCIVMSTSIEDSMFNFVQRAINILGEFPNPDLIKKTKHPSIFPPTVFFKYRKEFQRPTHSEGFNSISDYKFTRIDSGYTNKALLLDYDGTLRDCINGNDMYPTSVDQIRIRPRCKEILQNYINDYKIFGISNQSGIAKGSLTQDKAKELFDYTNKLLGIDIEYKFCPHPSHPISCYCRKPGIGFFVELMLKYKLSRKDCIFVGDMTSDKTFANRAGIQYVDQKEFFK
jgi:histidinol-phosphate phosphatase family protein